MKNSKKERRVDKIGKETVKPNIEGSKDQDSLFNSVKKKSNNNLLK